MSSARKHSCTAGCDLLAVELARIDAWEMQVRRHVLFAVAVQLLTSVELHAPVEPVLEELHMVNLSNEIADAAILPVEVQASHPWVQGRVASTFLAALSGITISGTSCEAHDSEGRVSPLFPGNTDGIELASGIARCTIIFAGGTGGNDNLVGER